jgi:hypothetical protein
MAGRVVFMCFLNGDEHVKGIFSYEG